MRPQHDDGRAIYQAHRLEQGSKMSDKDVGDLCADLQKNRNSLDRHECKALGQYIEDLHKECAELRYRMDGLEK